MREKQTFLYGTCFMYFSIQLDLCDLVEVYGKLKDTWVKDADTEHCLRAPTCSL